MMDKYKATLAEAQKDRDDLLKKREDLQDQREFVDSEIESTDKQIKQLDETIISLARLCNVTLPQGLARFLVSNRFGLTTAVRETLKKSTAALTAVEIRDILINGGFDASEYSNLLASIHTTLKRLAKSEELLSVEIEGKTAYKLNPDAPQRARMFTAERQAPTVNRIEMPAMRLTPPPDRKK